MGTLVFFYLIDSATMYDLLSVFNNCLIIRSVIVYMGVLLVK